MKTASNIIADAFQPESEVRKSVASWYTPGLSDGLGDRLLMFDNTSRSALELLRFRRDFAGRPQFEDALRRRVAELKHFSHPSIAKVRAVQWLGDGEGLALVSNQTMGRRLSEILHDARGQKFALELVRQITPALAALQQEGGAVSHGVITADRIIVTPSGQLILIEHVLGSAIETLNLTSEQLRAELGIPVPAGAEDGPSSGAGVPLDRRADVLQLGFVALSLIAGRPLDPAEYPRKTESLLGEFAAGAFDSSPSERLGSWLQRALQLGGDAFGSAQEAHEALEDVTRDVDRQLEEPRRTFDVVRPARTLEAPVANDPLPNFPIESPLEEEPAREVNRKVELFRPPSTVPPPGDRLDWAVDDRMTRVESPPPPAARPLVEEPEPASGSTRWIILGLSVAVVAEALVIGGMVLSRQRATPPAGIVATAPTPPPSVAPASAPKPEAATDAAAPAVPAAATTGRLEISSDPPGARVTIDGTRRGTTPLAIQLAAGPHTVVVSDGNTTSTRSVTIAAGGTATLMSALPAGGGAGWLSINSPLDLQVREGGSLIGITSADRLMLPAGHHELTLSGPAVGYQTTLSVDIPAGKTTSTTVKVPNGSVSINALPWANVWLDGQALGTTPLANLEVPLGSHEVIWRHPQFGERRQTVVVTAKAPVRVVMDLSK
jgi:hypothetical protein